MSFLELPDGTRMDVFGSGGGQRLAAAAGVPFLGSLPLDPRVRVGSDAGKPVVLSDPGSPVAQALEQVSRSLAATLSVRSFQQGNVIPLSMIE